MTRINSDYLSDHFHLMRTDPERYRAMAEQLIQAEPDNSDAYYTHHHVLTVLGRHEEALADMDIVVRLDPQWVTYESRANVLRNLGRYQEAVEDLNRAEAIDPEGWGGGFGHLFRADCHARLGNEEAALADCAALPENHWTPGVLGAPKGTKPEVIREVRRLVAQAKSAKQ